MKVSGLRAEHLRPQGDAVVVGCREPRLSWVTETSTSSWWQAAHEIEVDGVSTGWVETDRSVMVPWPAGALSSHDRVDVRVRVRGIDGVESPWSDVLRIEAPLLEPSDWLAEWIGPAENESPSGPGPAHRLRRVVHLDREVASARLHITSAGVHTARINGERVGDIVLAPGWSSYPNRLHYDTHDVTRHLTVGANVISAELADGWWRGELGWDSRRNRYGESLGLLAQLEVWFVDGTRATFATADDGRWRTSLGPVVASGLYAGESVDARRDTLGWDLPDFDDSAWAAAVAAVPDVGQLVVPIAPPIRRTEELPVVEVIRTPAGHTVLDVGQNVVGRMRFVVSGEAGTEITLRHAEVLENGEPAFAPLRTAAAVDRYVLRGGGPESWEPEYTFHGFRYVQVDGWPGEIDGSEFTAVVIHSDVTTTGEFECDHPLLQQLHRNVVWSLRGNIVGLPTDCPQRDERLGWTGDIQVFAPAATFLYDMGGFLGSWLEDVAAEQRDDGSVPVYVPILEPMHPRYAAGWSDAIATVPEALHVAYDDTDLLSRFLPAMRRWVDFVAERAGPKRLWTGDFQFGDWLDPSAPSSAPWRGATSPEVVATACFARSAAIVAEVADLLGEIETARSYRALADDVVRAFNEEYLTARGRLMSDSAAAYAIALRYGLVDDSMADVVAGNLERSVRASFWTISTGFLGTPVVLHALSSAGRRRTAYRLLTQTAHPSWLHPVTLGATTIWERWDSMRADGTVNPDGMTSFNHYAFGAVAEWMHEFIGGLAPIEPGWRRIRMAPVPGPGITSGSARHDTPYGTASCRWALRHGADGRWLLALDAVVPPNTTAEVLVPGSTTWQSVGSGTHHWDQVVDDAVTDDWRDAEWIALTT
jgi:alpha-L-rhamnosidase